MRLFRFFLLTLTALIAISASAQFADLPHDQNQIDIGVGGSGDINMMTATLILPVDSHRFRGWAGAYSNVTTQGDTLLARTINLHAQGGIIFPQYKGIGVELFANYEDNHQRGGRHARIGGMIRPHVYTLEDIKISGGFGNFFENEQAREDIGLLADDPNVLRWMLFTSFRKGNFHFLVEITPHVKLTDFQISFEPSIDIPITEQTDAVVKARIGFDSDPIMSEEYWHRDFTGNFRVKF